MPSEFWGHHFQQVINFVGPVHPPRRYWTAITTSAQYHGSEIFTSNDNFSSPRGTLDIIPFTLNCFFSGTLNGTSEIETIIWNWWIHFNLVKYIKKKKKVNLRYLSRVLSELKIETIRSRKQNHRFETSESAVFFLNINVPLVLHRMTVIVNNVKLDSLSIFRFFNYSSFFEKHCWSHSNTLEFISFQKNHTVQQGGKLKLSYMLAMIWLAVAHLLDWGTSDILRNKPFLCGTQYRKAGFAIWKSKQNLEAIADIVSATSELPSVRTLYFLLHPKLLSILVRGGKRSLTISLIAIQSLAGDVLL